MTSNPWLQRLDKLIGIVEVRNQLGYQANMVRSKVPIRTTWRQLTRNLLKEQQEHAVRKSNEQLGMETNRHPLSRNSANAAGRCIIDPSLPFLVTLIDHRRLWHRTSPLRTFESVYSST